MLIASAAARGLLVGRRQRPFSARGRSSRERAATSAGRAAICAAAAGVIGAALAVARPAGTDLAAHVYQRQLYLTHGFALWNNFWYAGRYSFVGYSLVYYPLAALLGIKLLGVLSVAGAAGAFAARRRAGVGRRGALARAGVRRRRCRLGR